MRRLDDYRQEKLFRPVVAALTIAALVGAYLNPFLSQFLPHWPQVAHAAGLVDQFGTDAQAGGWGANGEVDAIASSSGTVMYFGGSFSLVGHSVGPLAMTAIGSGSYDASFYNIASGSVGAIVGDGSQGWYVASYPLNAAGTGNGAVIHITSAGALDSSFSVTIGNSDGTAPTINALVLESSTLYVGGGFDTVNGSTRNGLAAVNATTGSLQSFNPNLGTGGTTYSIVASSSSTLVYVGGDFTTVNGATTRNNAAAFDTSTGTATSWDPNLTTGGSNGTVYALAASGSAVYVGGSFTRVNGGSSTINSLVAVDSSTGASLSFNPNVRSGVSAGEVRSLLLASDGVTLYVGGTFDDVNSGTTRNNAAAFATSDATATIWDPDISLEDSIWVGTTPIVNVLAASGSLIYAAGIFDHVNGSAESRNSGAAFNTTDGTVDAGWKPEISWWNPTSSPDGVHAIGISGSLVLIGGGFSLINCIARNGVAAVDLSDNTLTGWDPNITSGGSSPTIDTIVASGSVVYVGGAFDDVNSGTTRNNAAAFNTTDGTTTIWNPNLDNTVHGIIPYGSTVYVGGEFSTVNGAATRNGMAAFNTTDGTVTSWNPNLESGGSNGAAYVLVLHGSHIYVGGGFDTVNGGTTRNNLAAFAVDDGTVTSWDPDVDSSVYALLSYDSTIYAGGDFTTVSSGSAAFQYLAAFNDSDGTVVDSWTPAPDSSVYALAQYNGIIYAGGFFTSIGGAARTGLAALSADIGLAQPGDPRFDMSSESDFIKALAVVGDTLAASGFFSAVSGVAHANIATFAASTPTDSGDPVIVLHGDGLVRVAYGTTYTDAGAYAYDAIDGNLTSSISTTNSVDTNIAGTYTVTYSVSDSSGNSASASRTVVVLPSGGRMFQTSPQSGRYDGNGNVYAISQQVGDTVYVGGAFTAMGRNFPGEVLVDGLTGVASTSFAVPAVASSSLIVYAVVADGSGGWYIGGDFNLVGPEVHHNIAHVNADYTVDTDFTASVNGTVTALAASGSLVYVGGDFVSVSDHTASRSYIAAFNTSTGALDGWAPDITSGTKVSSILLHGSSAYVGGVFSQVDGGTVRNNAAAFDLTAATTGDWDPNPGGAVNALVASGSTIYMGGLFTTANDGTTRNYAAAVDDTNGTLTSWNPNLGERVYSLLVANGLVYVGGQFSTANGGTTRNGIAATSGSTGTITSWDPNVKRDAVVGGVYGMVASGSDVLAVGNFNTVNGSTSRNDAAAFDSSTGTATSWAPSVKFGGTSTNDDTVFGIIPVAGRFLLVGEFLQFDSTSRSRLAAINMSADSVESFNPAPDGDVYALMTDGATLYVGGAFTTIAGQSRAGFAAFDIATGDLLSLQSSAGATVRAMYLDGDRLYLAGTFGAVAISTATGQQLAFNPDLNSTAYAIAKSGSTIYIGGDFTTVNGGTSRVNLAAFDTSGTVTSFDAHLASASGVFALTADSGTLYVGGTFDDVNTSTSVHNLIGVDLTTGDLSDFHPTLNGQVNALAIDGTSLYVGGAFTVADGETRNRLAVFDTSDGSLGSFSDGFGAQVNTLFVDTNALNVGGNFRFVPVGRNIS